MRRKVFLCKVDERCPDYVFTKAVIQSTECEESSLEEAGLCLFNAGVYISGHNAKALEAELQRAIALGKEIVVIKPFGTSYMPLFFRRLQLRGIELLASQIEAVVKGVEVDETKLLLQRYC